MKSGICDLMMWGKKQCDSDKKTETAGNMQSEAYILYNLKQKKAESHAEMQVYFL